MRKTIFILLLVRPRRTLFDPWRTIAINCTEVFASDGQFAPIEEKHEMNLQFLANSTVIDTTASIESIDYVEGKINPFATTDFVKG